MEDCTHPRFTKAKTYALLRLECTAIIIVHYSLQLLGSEDPLISASRVAGITGSCPVARAGVQWSQAAVPVHRGPNLPGSGHLRTSAPRRPGFAMSSRLVLNPWLGSGKSPASASQSVKITGVSHWAWSKHESFPAEGGRSEPGRAAGGGGGRDRGGQGLLRTDPVPGEGEAVAAALRAAEPLSEEAREELRRGLAKVEETQSLSQASAAKEKHLAEIKCKLGYGNQNRALPKEARRDSSICREEDVGNFVPGCTEGSAACPPVGAVIAKKLEDVKNSPTSQSFEEKAKDLKSKVGEPSLLVATSEKA
ncbi:Tumor protein D52 [Plecturocebus cupreus]